MLKKLELIGFKSFADRTAFEFAAGITAVVGPNGSGKSNVVDAVKWVLGEQSAKSLRSGGMADVIFNGSTTRRPHSQAEVTLTFDNSRGILADAAAEVRIGRRVFRDGNSEYLINGQVGRLKDIKDLFLGTGAGSGAYSIIEQGRVDALLQASQEDRRAIFEEAAGVSRYKAKKIECMRRLERVAQNLARLQDILTEVEHQLRSVRLQAAKALKYQEHTVQLKELRLALGLKDYQSLVERLTQAEADVAVLRAAMDECAAHSTGWTQRTNELEAALASASTHLRQCEQILNETKARVDVLNGALERDREVIKRLDVELARDLLRREAMERQLSELTAAADRAGAEYAAAEQQVKADSEAANQVVEQVRMIGNAVAGLRSQVEDIKNEHLEQLREAARWQNDAVSVKAQIDQLTRERDRMTVRTAKAANNLTSLDTELESLRSAESALEDRLARARELIAVERQKRDASQSLIGDCQTELTNLRAEAAGLTSRIDVLESWYRERDGLGAGVRHVFDHLKETGNDAILGWLPDCLTTSRADAPLIDLALGTAAQHFIVRRTSALLNWLTNLSEPLPGRVGFIDLSTNVIVPEPVVGAVCASTLIQCERPELADIPGRMLGNVFIAPDLAAAHDLAARHPFYRFVTRAGELIEADGSLIVGRQSAESGVLARKSELRDLRQQAESVDERIADVESELSALEDQVAAADAAMAMCAQESVVLAEQLNDMRSRIVQHAERRAGLHSEVRVSRKELSALSTDIERDEQQWNEFVAKAEAAAERAQDTQAALTQSEDSIRDQERQQQQLQQTHTVVQVALGRARERLDALCACHEQAQRVIADRQADLQSLTEQIAAIEARIEQCRSAIAAAQAELIEVLARRTKAEEASTLLAAELESLRAEQSQLRSQLQSAQAEWQRFNDELHSRELVARDLTNQRDTLITRLAEDYQIDLAAEWASGSAPNLGDRTSEQAQAEIDDLRGKLHRLGSVNLESLDELAQVEQKHKQLQTQFDDLTQARKSLDDSIHKINADSKRLFVETFANVKTHFQDLFRRLFGGGMADIVLEKPDDPLESPIDIIARPPGKELRSIALMSGGERTMTAVALLLAIFRSKPSPFCILDEVDAALDEANTARLTHVLREFADSSQFIVITHAKRTMAAADVLYGVTMQESGISKRVAVRFDEWPDDAKKAA
jgi:chromosome segregation protein